MSGKLRRLIELKLRGCMDSHVMACLEYKFKSWGVVQGRYGRDITLAKLIQKKENISQDDFDKFLEISEHVQDIKNKFTLERQKHFDGDIIDFYDWYESQGQKCHYCGITAEDLKALFDAKIITSRKFMGILHIGRFDPDKGYIKENMGLACSLCSNAKSDMISEEDYTKYFTDAMKKFYDAKKKELNNMRNTQ